MLIFWFCCGAVVLLMLLLCWSQNEKQQRQSFLGWVRQSANCVYYYICIHTQYMIALMTVMTGFGLTYVWGGIHYVRIYISVLVLSLQMCENSIDCWLGLFFWLRTCFSQKPPKHTRTHKCTNRS